MFKKTIVYLFLILFSLPFLGFAGYCDGNTSGAGEKPPICYNSPEVVNKYLQDMVYVISLVSDSKSNSSGFGALGKKALDTGIGSLGVATMFASNGFGNFFQNFIIIFKGPDIVRDRVKITNFQQYITKKALKIASKGILNENISNLTEIKNYMNGKNSFIINFEGTTYKDLFKYLWQNQLLFEKIYYDKIVLREDITTIENNITSIILNNGGLYYLNSNALIYLGSKFDVYNKYNCNTSWDDFKKDLKHVICTIGGDKLKDANERFYGNYRRLLYVLGLGNKGDKTYAQNYGSVAYIETGLSLSQRLKAKVNIEGIGTLSYNNEGIQNGWTEDTQSLNQMSKDLQKYSGLWNGIKKLGSEMNPSNWQVYKTFTGNVSPADYAIKKQKDFIDSNLQAVINDYNDVKNMTDGVEAGSATHGITILFPQISQQIDEIRQKIGKNTTKNGTIYKNLEKTCQNQSPQKGNCSYSK